MFGAFDVMTATFFFHFQVKFSPDHPDYGQYPGAYADLWVVDETLEMAEAKARHYLDEYMYEIVALEVATTTAPDQYEGRPLGLAFHQKAQRYGIALSLAAWEQKAK